MSSNCGKSLLAEAPGARFSKWNTSWPVFQMSVWSHPVHAAPSWPGSSSRAVCRSLLAVTSEGKGLMPPDVLGLLSASLGLSHDRTPLTLP